MVRPLPLSRPLLYVIAFIFAAATTLYSAIWMYYIRQPGAAYIGIHYEYSAVSRSIVIVRVAEGSSAQQAGLRPGDRILAVNNTPLRKVTPFYDFVDRGVPGSAVWLTVLRPGEASPTTARVVLQTPRPPDWYLRLTILGAVALQIMCLYPLPLLLVGFAVLFLRVDDRNAWLVALLFSSLIALAQIPEGYLHPALRNFQMTYHVVLGAAMPALFYWFFAVFPAPSALERRLPWLKRVFLVAASVTMLWGLRAVVVAGTGGSLWLFVEYFQEKWPASFIFVVTAVYSVASQVLGLVSLALNSVRAPTAEARRKARVIVGGVVGGLLPMLLFMLFFVLGERPFEELPFWAFAVPALAMFLIPLSFAYAVVKHRVMEIPVLLKRSARYVLVQRGFAFLTVLWGVGFTGLFTSVGLGLSHILPWDPRLTLPAVVVGAVSFGSLLALAGAHVHRQVTQKIDRAFFRSTYDAHQILARLVEETRQVTGRKRLAGLLAGEISQALHPVSLAVYIESRDGLLRVERDTAPPTFKPLSPHLPLLEELARRGEPWEIPAPPTGEGSVPEGLGKLGPVQPECLVPVLRRDGRLTGLIALGPRLSEEPYSREDRRLLASVASQAGVTLENIGLAEQMADRMEAERRAAHEMEIAKQVQARLFPQKLPPLETLDYAGGCVQAREVGGDYYDFLDLGPGRVGIVLADIAGKGISGALLMANLQANLRSQYAVALDNLPRLLESVNRLFYQNTGDTSFATLFFADYQDTSRRLRYVNCGHNPPYLVRSDGRVERLTATATVLGLFERWDCRVAEVELAPTDLVVIYTDGITEALSDEGEEYGESRLLETILDHRGRPVPELLKTILTSVQAFSGSEQEDDLTLVAARAR